MNTTSLQEELERELDYIAELLKKNANKVLDNALDVQVIVNLPNKELVGFDLNITTGSPNIYFVYRRGKCTLEGYWGSAEVEKYVDREICETVLDYLSQTV